MIFGREKRFGEPNRLRRWGYALLGELHIPGRLRARHIMRSLRQLGLWRNDERSVLDAGGGKGALAYHLARRFPNWRVVVADDDGEALGRGHKIKQALPLPHLELRNTDLAEIDDRDRFDLVIAADVLEHIDDDGGALRSLADALKPGGVLVITSPSQPQPTHLPTVAWREQKIGFTPQEYGHVRDGYSAEDLQALLDGAGLVAQSTRYTFGRCGTLMFDLFFSTGDSKPHPLVFAGLFPLYLLLSEIDLRVPAHHGAAILAIARKPTAAPATL